MSTKTFFVVFTILGLLVSCAQLNPHPMDMTTAIREAKTPADHNALARHYEAAAEAARLKVKEHKKELEAHCRRLISSHEQVAEANAVMAETHRRMAAEAR